MLPVLPDPSRLPAVSGGQSVLLSRLEQRPLDVQNYSLSNAIHHHSYLAVGNIQATLQLLALGREFRVTTVYSGWVIKKKTGPLKPALAPRLLCRTC